MNEQLKEAVDLLAAMALLGSQFFDEEGDIPGENIDSIISISAHAAGFLVRNQDVLREVMSEEQFREVADKLDFQGIEDEAHFGSAQFTDRGSA